MRKRVIALVLLAVLGLAAQVARAAPVLSFAELGFKSSIDGVVYDSAFGPWAPVGADLTGFNMTTGLGTVKYTFSGAGSYYVAGFFDYQFVDPLVGGGIFDELGAVVGAPGAGQSWEIDEPGWVFGDIYDHFKVFDFATPLEMANTNPAGPEDVSVALGYAFTLGAGDPDRDVYFTVSLAPPTSGYYLEHSDPSGSKVYFQQTTQAPGPGPIPEPAMLTLFGLGLAAVSRRLRRRA